MDNPGPVVRRRRIADNPGLESSTRVVQYDQGIVLTLMTFEGILE